MDVEVSIGKIIEFLEDEKYVFSFRGNKNDTINGFSTLFNYRGETITFLSSLNKFSDYNNQLKNEKIKLIIIDTSESIYDCFENVIQIEKPKYAFFEVLDNFFSGKHNNTNETLTKEKLYEGQAYISKQAVIGNNVKIGAGCVIEDNVHIGDNTVIHHNVVLKNGTKIGGNCLILSGTIIGENGFNPLKQVDSTRNLLKHYGGVTIEDNVHIGDNCTISRGTIDDTLIKQGVKINKQVVIAHNVVIGQNTVITAPTFVCGDRKSTRLNSSHVAISYAVFC